MKNLPSGIQILIIGLTTNPLHDMSNLIKFKNKQEFLKSNFYSNQEFLAFANRIFKNVKRRAREAFKYHNCEHLIPKIDHDQEYEKILGCDRFQFAQYLKSKFKDGMNETNYGIEGWHIDHIFPLARANPENLIFWLHHLNTQPLWKKQNEDKCDYIFDLDQVRSVQKLICESKNINYVDTIDPTEVCKYSRPYLKELKNKGQITDQEILEIREKHKKKLKCSNNQKNNIKLTKAERKKLRREKKQNKNLNKQKQIQNFNQLKLMYEKLEEKCNKLEKENETLKNKLYEPKKVNFKIPLIETPPNQEYLAMFEELFSKQT